MMMLNFDARYEPFKADLIGDRDRFLLKVGGPVVIDGVEVGWDCMVVADEPIRIGDVGRVKITAIASPSGASILHDRLSAGMRFSLNLGHQLVGFGEASAESVTVTSST